MCPARRLRAARPGEIDDLQGSRMQPAPPGTMTADAHAMLGSRLDSARKALTEKTTAKAVHCLNQYVDFAGRSVDNQALRDGLVSGAQALIVRLTS